MKLRLWRTRAIVHVTKDLQLVSAAYQDLQKRQGAAKHESCQHLHLTTTSHPHVFSPVTTSLLLLVSLQFLLVSSSLSYTCDTTSSSLRVRHTDNGVKVNYFSAFPDGSLSTWLVVVECVDDLVFDDTKWLNELALDGT